MAAVLRENEVYAGRDSAVEIAGLKRGAHRVVDRRKGTRREKRARRAIADDVELLLGFRDEDEDAVDLLLCESVLGRIVEWRAVERRAR